MWKHAALQLPTSVRSHARHNNAPRDQRAVENVHRCRRWPKAELVVSEIMGTCTTLNREIAVLVVVAVSVGLKTTLYIIPLSKIFAVFLHFKDPGQSCLHWAWGGFEAIMGGSGCVVDVA